MYDRATLSVIHTIKKQHKLQFSILALSLSLSLCVLQHIIYTHFTHIMAETQQQWQYSVLYTPSKSNTNYSSQFSISLSLLPSIIYTHFTHIMAKNTTAMATLHIITEKILLCTPLLSLLTKCLIDSNKILIINIFAIKQRVNRKKISVIIFCAVLPPYFCQYIFLIA